MSGHRQRNAEYIILTVKYVRACSAGARLVATGSFFRAHIGEFIDAHFEGDFTFGMLVIVCNNSFDCFNKNLESFVFVVLVTIRFIMFTLERKKNIKN